MRMPETRVSVNPNRCKAEAKALSPLLQLLLQLTLPVLKEDGRKEYKDNYN